MKNILSLLLIFVLITGCSKDDSTNQKTIEETLVGNKYAHLNFETREECEAAQEQYFINCAQVLEILNDSEAQIILTDIVYNVNFFIENNELIVESSPTTYEFSEDLIFTLLESGNLKLNGSNWIEYEEDYYE